ncbi:hypothetical protein QQ054_24605 [Oscillatoria amoena NRMC-F 0135]|nr:hypothetical protein [Oscillatoria amoena NRMC-F 0135]
MKKPSLAKYNIDWPNHVIGFFSALFGILIAFELDEWRERHNQQELADIAFSRMLTEIEFNQGILHANLNENLDRIRVLDRLTEKLNDQLLFVGEATLADSVNQHYPAYIHIESGQAGPSGSPVHIVVSSLSMIPQHTSAWESAKATGALNYLGYERVIAISSVYNYSIIVEELRAIHELSKRADDITTRSQLRLYLDEVEKSLKIVERELAEYDQFVSILKSFD